MEKQKSKYFTAQAAYKLKQYRKAISDINEYLRQDGKNGIDARELFILAKSYSFVGNINDSIKIYKIIIELNPSNVHARIELGKIYVKQRKEAEAERLFTKVIELDAKNVHARLELGRLYVKQGKEAEAEQLFKEYMDIEPNNVHARMELGKLYAEQGKTELSSEMYNYIIDTLDDETFNQDNRTRHIIKHMKDNKTKANHGVFTINPLEILEYIKGEMNENNKKIGYMSDVYVIKVEGCGYAGGQAGNGHTLDYITVITLPNSYDLITMFPSDNIFEIEKDKNSTLGTHNSSHDNDGR